MGLSAAASCEAEDLDDSRVAVFEGNCFHFMSQEVKGPIIYFCSLLDNAPTRLFGALPKGDELSEPITQVFRVSYPSL